MIAVTGASGFVGEYVVDALLDAGHDPDSIVALGRTAPANGTISWVRTDLPAEVPPYRTGVTAVVHIAAEKRDGTRMKAVNVDGTQRMIEWATAVGARRFVLLSSVGVFGARENAGLVTSATPHRPCNEYERTKDVAERLVESAGRDGTIDAVIVRPSNVIGVHRRTGGAPLLGFLRSVKRGLLVQFPGIAWSNYVAVQDVAAAVAAAVTSDRLSGSFIVNEAIAVPDFIVMAAEAIGCRVPEIRMPRRLGAAVATVGSLLENTIGHKMPFDRAKFRELTNGTRYDGEEAWRALGFAYAYGVRRCVRELAECYTSAGLL